MPVSFDNVKIGTSQVSKVYVGTTEVWVYDVTDPITTISPAGGTYYDPITVTLSVNEAGSTTYYTTNGTTPTTSSTRYTGAFTVSATTTVKYFSVDAKGNQESVKTTTYTMKNKYRYIRFIGYGDNTGTATTRLVELQAIDVGGTNRILNRSPISGETPNAGSSVANATDGSTSMASGTYPIWWTGAGVPTLVYDCGAQYEITQLKVWMFSTTNDPRATKFIVAVSEDKVTWKTIANYSNNTTTQPSAGWSFTVS